MNKKIFFGIIGLWALALFAYVSWEHPPASIQNAAPILPRAEGLFADFSSGSTAFDQRTPIESACANLMGVDKSACLQGYLTAWHRDGLLEIAEGKTSAKRYQIPELVKTEPDLHSVWNTALGMALYQRGYGPETAKPYVSGDGAYGYVIDGWAFASLLARGLSATTEACAKQFKGSELNYCLFGVGRGAYFQPIALAGIEMAPQSLKAGFLFSQALNGADPDDASFKTDMGKAGRMVRSLWISGREPMKTKANWLSCLDHKHVSECADLH